MCDSQRGWKILRRNIFFERSFLLPEGWGRWRSDWPVSFGDKTGWRPKLPLQDRVPQSWGTSWKKHVTPHRRRGRHSLTKWPILGSGWEGVTEQDQTIDTHWAAGREILGCCVSLTIYSTQGISGQTTSLFLPSQSDLQTQNVHYQRVLEPGWTTGLRMNGFFFSTRWEEVEEGKNCRAEELQTCLNSCFFYTLPRPPWKETLHYRHFADLNLRSAGLSFPFWYPIPHQRRSAVSLQHFICQASIGTNRTVNPGFSSRTWLLGSRYLPPLTVWPG